MGSGEPFACDLSAFTDVQRARHAELTQALRRAGQGVEELEDGFAFTAGSDQAAFERAAEWVALELRCCPFLSFDLSWEEGKPVVLRITGPAGVKAFIATEIRGAK